MTYSIQSLDIFIFSVCPVGLISFPSSRKVRIKWSTMNMVPFPLSNNILRNRVEIRNEFELLRFGDVRTMWNVPTPPWVSTGKRCELFLRQTPPPPPPRTPWILGESIFFGDSVRACPRSESSHSTVDYYPNAESIQVGTLRFCARSESHESRREASLLIRPVRQLVLPT